MIVLEIKFPAGRFHATPWGRHVNEGAVEWPPSPWRILRALVATWHLKARDEVDEAIIRSLLDKLSAPPRYRLPRAVTSHLRHYMPYNDGKNEKTTKVFDTFVQLAENEAILVGWEIELTPEEHEAFQTLADRIGYFGRAESLAIASVSEKSSPLGFNAEPFLGDAEPPADQEIVRALAPMSANAYVAWREEYLRANAPEVGAKKTKSKKGKESDGSQVPPDLFTAFRADTGELQAAGWNLPPGAEFLAYTRPRNIFAPATKPRSRRAGPIPTLARYALTSVVPPSILKSLAVSEQLHTVLVDKSGGNRIFTGAGQVGHQHAFIFNESVDNLNAHITHVTIYAPGGFDENAVQTLRAIRWTWGFKEHELRLVLHGLGRPEEFPDCRLFAKSQTWQSVTPFVSSRHAKTFRDGRPKIAANGWQDGSPGHDLLRLLALDPGHADAKIQLLNERELPYRFGQRRFRSLQFLTQRNSGGGSRGNDSGAAFRISFPEARSGPLALGYGAHFGLGLFGPMD